MQNTEKNSFQLTDECLPHTLLLSSQNSLQCKKVIKKLLQLFSCSFPFSKISNKSVEKNPKHPRQP